MVRAATREGGRRTQSRLSASISRRTWARGEGRRGPQAAHPQGPSVEGCDIPRRQKCDTDPQGQEAAAEVRAQDPGLRQEHQGGVPSFTDGCLAMASQDSGTSGSPCPELEPRQKPNFSPAVSTPRGRKGFVLKRVRAWPAGRAFKRSSSDLLAADPRGAGRLLLSRPRPPVFTEPHESELSASGIPSPTRVKDHFQNRLSN